MSSCKHLIPIFVTLFVVSFGSAPVEARNARNRCITCVPARACPTVFRAGKEDGQLQVHITGKNFNVVETYLFDNYYADAVSGETNLHCNSEILLAKPSDYGTFAVRYGKCFNQFVAYGVFKKRKLVKITNDPRQLNNSDVGLVTNIDSGFPISLSWVSTRLLKIKHGSNGSKSLVLKFFGEEGSGYWAELHGDGNATQINPPSP